MNKQARLERDKLIIKEFKECLTPQELADKHAISYQRVLQIISDHGFKFEHKTNSVEDNNIVIAFLNAAENNLDVENVFKTWGKSKVYYVLGKHDIKPKKVLIEKRNMQIAEDFRMGVPPKEIAEHYKINQSYVYELLSNMGLKTFPTTAEIKIRNAEIRTKYKTGDYTQETLAIEYNLSRGCIGLILTYAAPYND